jgi:hypothetical protein
MDLDTGGILEIEVRDFIVPVLGQVLLSLMLHITNILEQRTLLSFCIHSFGIYKKQRYDNI